MTRSERSSAASLALTLASAFWFLPLRAAAAETDEAGARALFAEGRKLADIGNYAEACPKFEESFKLDPGTGTNFNLADCLEHIGRTASAWARFLDVAAATKAAGQLERERVARLRAENLEPKLARLVVEVSAQEPGLFVKRDGVSLGPAAWGLPVPVDPGDHAILAGAPGKRAVLQTTTVPEGPTTVVVTIPALEALPPEIAPIPASSPAPVVRASETQAPSRWTIPVVALGALGVIGLTTSTVFLLQFASENADAKELCPASSCPTQSEKIRHDELVAEAKSDRNVAIVSAGIGGAALLSAVYLWWQPFRSSPSKRAAAPLELRPILKPLAVELEVAW